MTLYWVGRRDGDNGGLFSFEWTPDPPTTDGLYWVQTKHSVYAFFLEGSRLSGLYSGDYFLDELIEKYNITRWLGPLPYPRIPQDE